jgi:hypothetical protein
LTSIFKALGIPSAAGCCLAGGVSKLGSSEKMYDREHRGGDLQTLGLYLFPYMLCYSDCIHSSLSSRDKVSDISALGTKDFIIFFATLISSGLSSLHSMSPFCHVYSFELRDEWVPG